MEPSLSLAKTALNTLDTGLHTLEAKVRQNPLSHMVVALSVGYCLRYLPWAFLSRSFLRILSALLRPGLGYFLITALFDQWKAKAPAEIPVEALIEVKENANRTEY